jgi:hypothetical protein
MRCRAGTVPVAVARNGPGSAEQHFVLRRVRDKNRVLRIKPRLPA